MAGGYEWEVAQDRVEGGDEYGSPSGKSAVSTNTEDAPRPHVALIKEWSQRIVKEKQHHAPAFKRMDYCMQIAAEGAEKEWVESDQYTVPVANRHINTVVAALYAKNPTVVAKRKKKLLYSIWDGSLESLQQAMVATQQVSIDPVTGMRLPPDPNAVALIEEVSEAQRYLRMTTNMGKTMEILVEHFLQDDAANYKEELKAVVRRTKTVGAGFVRLQFQRVMEKLPSGETQVADVTALTAAAQADAYEIEKGTAPTDGATVAELENMNAAAQADQDVIVSEGPVLDFPAVKQVIIDRRCKHLKTLRGANWIAYEYDKTPKEILEDFGVDVGTTYTGYNTVESSQKPKEGDPGLAKVWEVWDKRSQQVFVICDGFANYLRPPGPPDVRLKRFYDLFPIIFNEVENDKQLYPPSDIWLIRHPQQDYNRARQGLREHRQANRPKYAVPKGRLDDSDMDKLRSHPSSAILALKGLAPGEDVGKLIQRIPLVGIDPNQYLVEDNLNDIMRTVGSQEANLGGMSNGTATEAAIGEQSRGSTLADNVDDLDDGLTSFARSLGELLLLEMSKEQVVEIVGPGAVWPEMPMTRQQVIKDVYLDIRAASTGRPNEAKEMAVLQQLTPLVVQIPGVQPKALADKAATILGVDLDDFFVEGMPSLQATNAIAGAPQLPTGNPATDPSQQGAEGVENAPAGPGVQNGPGVPALPAAGAMAVMGGQPLVQA